MAASEEFATFDVVLVPFPFSDRMAEKRRPAVIVSRPHRLAPHGHLWLVMVTSALQVPWPSDVEITDLEQAGLPSPSVVRTAKIATTEADRIIRRLGCLDSKAAEAVRREIIDTLG